MTQKAFVRERAEQLVNSLNYDFDNFAMDDYVAWIEQLIGRHIHFIKWKMPVHITGIWFTDAEDPLEYIFIAHDLPPLLEIQVKLHELAHVLNNHPTAAITGEMLQRVSAGNLDIETLYQMSLAIKRSAAPDTLEQETEAEQTAAIIQERINQFVRSRKLSEGSHDAETQTFLRNIGLG